MTEVQGPDPGCCWRERCLEPGTIVLRLPEGRAPCFYCPKHYAAALLHLLNGETWTYQPLRR